MNKHLLKLAMLILISVTIPFVSIAEINLSALSYEELIALQKQVSQELRAKEPADGMIVYDKDGVKVIFQGIKTGTFVGAQFLIENASNKSIGVSFEDVSVNDFMMNVLFSTKVSAGKKAIDSLDFIYLEDFGITTIENIELSVQIFDSESYRTIDLSDPVVINP